MKRQLLFVHGAGEEAYDEDRKMVECLRDEVSEDAAGRLPDVRGVARPDS